MAPGLYDAVLVFSDQRRFDALGACGKPHDGTFGPGRLLVSGVTYPVAFSESPNPRA